MTQARFSADPTRRRRHAALAMELKHARECAGMSRAELAQRAGFDQRAIGAYEEGRECIGLHRAWDVADALGLCLGDLFAAVERRVSRGGRLPSRFVEVT